MHTSISVAVYSGFKISHFSYNPIARKLNDDDEPINTTPLPIAGELRKAASILATHKT
jgi:hypothetical protein